MTILYIVLVSVFLGWGFFHRKRKRNPVSRTKPLINVPNGNVIRRINSQKDENVPMQVHSNLNFLIFFCSLIGAFLLLMIVVSAPLPLTFGTIIMILYCWLLSMQNSLVNLYFSSQMLEDVPQINSGVQLSIVQGYMSKFYR